MIYKIYYKIQYKIYSKLFCPFFKHFSPLPIPGVSQGSLPGANKTEKQVFNVFHDLLNALSSTQMKMLRAVLGRGRIKKQPDEEVETWVEWIQRVTHEARLAMKEHKVPDWIEEQRKRLQAWRQKLDSMSKDRWATKVLNWSPEGYRSRGRPLARWSDQAATATLSPQGT